MDGEGISERKVEIRVRKNGRKDKVIMSLKPYYSLILSLISLRLSFACFWFFVTE